MIFPANNFNLFYLFTVCIGIIKYHSFILFSFNAV